jgi:chemotaxis protein MotB
MARRKKREAHENHERWLVSYADFITLLFAFFVVMFATSQTDKNKAEQMQESMRRALEGDHVPAILAAVLGGTIDNKGQGNAELKGPGGVQQRVLPRQKEKRDQKLAELLPSLKVLSEELKKEIAEGRIQITMQPRGLVISFTQAALFPSGEDVISPSAYGGLAKVAAAIRKIPNPVRMEGHTDSVPIHSERFHSNWDLSAARSTAVLELMSERFGVPQDRMSIAGYADTAPVASNQSEEGRARNRRVDIVVLNEQGILGEPVKPEDAKPENTRPEDTAHANPDHAPSATPAPLSTSASAPSRGDPAAAGKK